MSFPLWVFAACVAVALGWIALTASPAAPNRQGGAITGKVRYIVDGDTLYLENMQTPIRLWGLDAPEMDEERGGRSRRYLTTLTGSKRLTCHPRGKDRHGRIVALCTLPDGRDIAAAMIRSGHAKEYRKYSKGYYSDL